MSTISTPKAQRLQQDILKSNSRYSCIEISCQCIPLVVLIYLICRIKWSGTTACLSRLASPAQSTMTAIPLRIFNLKRCVGGRIFYYSSTTGGDLTSFGNKNRHLSAVNSNISTPGKPWNKGDSLTKPTFWVDFETECHYNSPRLIAHGPHLSSLHKPHLRCGVASAWQPQHLATRSTRAGFAISSTFPVVDNGTNSMITELVSFQKCAKMWLVYSDLARMAWIVHGYG